METIEKQIENSSQVEKVKYNDGDKILTITFKSKSSPAVYSYFGVEKDVFDGLLQAESVGKYINTNVKGKYEYKRIEL